MQDDTQSIFDRASCAPREGVFIPRKQVQKMRRARDLVDDAQRRARDLLKQAATQADAIRQAAFDCGFEEGALAAAAQALAHFGAVADLTQSLRAELERHARDLLRESLDRPEAILALLDQCLQGLAGPPGQPVSIRLPASMRGQRGRLNAAIEQTGHGAAEIGYHDDPRLIVLYGEQIFEFDPPVLIEQGQDRLLRNFPALETDCRQLSEMASQRWRDSFEQRFMEDSEDPAAGLPDTDFAEDYE
jgi:hypothetical protein